MRCLFSKQKTKRNYRISLWIILFIRSMKLEDYWWHADQKTLFVRFNTTIHVVIKIASMRILKPSTLLHEIHSLTNQDIFHFIPNGRTSQAFLLFRSQLPASTLGFGGYQIHVFCEVGCFLAEYNSWSSNASNQDNSCNWLLMQKPISNINIMTDKTVNCEISQTLYSILCSSCSLFSKQSQITLKKPAYHAH